MFFIFIKYSIGIIIFLSFWHIGLTMIDPDLGWHLKVGEKILTNRSVPYFDEYSWTMSGFGWVDHEWSVDAWLAYIHSHHLWWMAILAFTFFAAIPFFVWIWRSRDLAQVWMVILAAISIIPFIGIRPQIISFLLFFVVFELLRKEKLILLPLIFLIWANLHAGFFVGLILFVLFIIAKWISKDFSLAFRMTAVFFLSFAGTFINPYGWKVYKEIFTVILSSETMRYIVEWQPIFSKFDFIWILYLGIFLALILIFRKRYQLTDIFISIFFALAAIKSARNWPIFLIIAMPILFSGVDFAREGVKSAQNKKPLDGKTYMILRNISIVAYIFVAGFFGYRLYEYKPMKFPEKSVVFLSDKIKSGRWQDVKLLNDYGWGGYLINNAPNVKVFIDGRMPHWIDENGNSAMKDYIKIFYLKNADDRKEVFLRRGIDTVLIGNENNSSLKKSFLGNFSPYYADKIKQFIHSRKLIIKANEILNRERSVDLKKVLLASGWIIEYEDEVAVILRKQ